MACKAPCLPSRTLLNGFSPPPVRSSTPILPFLVPFSARRHVSHSKKAAASPKKKKENKYFRREDMRKAETFALCDAMRYLRAVEVGQPPTSTKYELAISIRTVKNGPVIRNRLRLPHTVDTSQRIAVLCPPDSAAARASARAGAVAVGEDSLLDAIKAGRIEFNRLLCHADSAQKLNRANVGRALGPKGLMPSAKTGTIVADVGKAIGGMIGATEYRERMGVVRLAIGQLAFTPEMMMANIRELMTAVKREASKHTDKLAKDIHEVVLSSTHGPGFPLSGDFQSKSSLPTKDLSVL